MSRRAAPYTTVLLIALAAVLCATAAPSVSASPAYGIQKQIASLNAVLDVARTQSLKTNDTLLDRVYARGRLPVIVRLRDSDQHYGLLLDTQSHGGNQSTGCRAWCWTICSRRQRAMKPRCM